MANNGPFITWKRLRARQKMYVVLSLCCALLAITAGVALLLTRTGASGSPMSGLPQSEPLSTEDDYDMNENPIDTDIYSATILPETADAGDGYVQSTLFIGDSNTARTRMFGMCTYENSIGSVGMSARQLETFSCVGFSGYNGYVTIPQAVALMQPQRVLIGFGTNDLNPQVSAETFIRSYQAGIEAVQRAYPSVDIIINAIPPLGRARSGENLTQTQVDAYNSAIVEMCSQKGWKFLNSAEELKDSATGFARDEYVESSDGIHLTRAGMQALFTYFRTHSYLTEDDRPPLSDIPRHTEDKDVSAAYSGPTIPTPAPTGGDPVDDQPQDTPAPPTEEPSIGTPESGEVFG